MASGALAAKGVAMTEETRDLDLGGDLGDQGARREAVMPISVYLLRHWTRHLGPEGVCLIIGARQLAYEQRRRAGAGGHASGFRARIRAGGRTLARRAGISHSTARRLLADRGERGLALAAFLLPAMGDGCYHVRRDDPLAPQHGRGLAARLGRRVRGEAEREGGSSELGAMGGQDAQALLDALEELAALPSAEALAALEEEQVGDEVERAGWPESVLSAVTSMGLMPSLASLQALVKQRCHHLQRHLTSPHRVVLTRRAFWRDALPAVKPPQMITLLALRSRCFHDRRTGELRETCKLPVARLAIEMGVSRRQLSRMAGVLADHDLARTLSLGNGRRPTEWWVRMIDQEDGPEARRAGPPTSPGPDGSERSGTPGEGVGDMGTSCPGHPEHVDEQGVGHAGHTIEYTEENDSPSPGQGRAPERARGKGRRGRRGRKPRRLRRRGVAAVASGIPPP